MQWAWLIPVLSFAAAPIIVIIGNRLPPVFKIPGGALFSISAIVGGFVFFWIALFGFLGASTGTENCYTAVGTGALTCNFDRVWFKRRTARR